jgi:DNA-binding beta-propeller fold protein YncE
MLFDSGRHKYEIVPGWLKNPEALEGGVPDIAIDAQDRLWCLTRGVRPINAFDQDGKLFASWGEGAVTQRPGNKSPSFTHGIDAALDGTVWFTNLIDHTVLKFSSEGELLMEFGSRGQPSDSGYPGWPVIDMKQAGMNPQKAMDMLMDTFKMKVRPAAPFNMPCAVSVTPSGDFYVADGYGNVRVHKFNQKGELLFSWGELGTDPGQFIVVHSVLFDRQKNVWVCDREGDHIQVFTAEGKYIRGIKGVVGPSRVVIDKEDTVLVPEFFGGKLSFFDYDGNPLGRWTNDPVKYPNLFDQIHSVAVDSTGNIYIAKTFGKELIIKFAKVK